MSADEYLMFVDVETTGLNPRLDVLLEVGFRLTDLDFNVLEENSQTIKPSTPVELLRIKCPEVVRDMHDKNGLWEECKESLHIHSVALKFYAWIEEIFEKYDIGNGELPLAGSSLALDRGFLNYHMSSVHKLFHYRSIDNSSIKELCRRYNPALYDLLPDSDTDHRVRTCLNGTMEEMKFYVDNFIFQ